ncbi:MAG: ACT domain-containing protein [Dehalococcoidia bacterium]
MTAYRSIRIRMTDRPGALSAVGAALAAHRVDIVRLDVVSHEDGTVVDDLFLSAEDDASLDRATASFFGDVDVRPLRGFASDPVTGMATALGAVASAATVSDALAAVAAGVQLFLPSDLVAVLRGRDGGGYDILVGPAGLPTIGASDPFVFRGLSQSAEMSTGEPWAPPEFTGAFPGARVAAAPCGPVGLLLVAREEGLTFYRGELQRLAAYATAAACIAGSKDGALWSPFGELVAAN